MRNEPIVVIGAGAAGLMAAYFAAEGARRVILLERTSDGGRKILISGGGRCNVLPSRFEPSQYFTDSSPNILRNILRSFPDTAQRRFFERELQLQLALEEATGKLFPASGRARDVRDALLHAAHQRGVEQRFGARVTTIAQEGASWQITIAEQGQLQAHAVIIATGGLSVPQAGSDGTGLEIARALGHTIRPTYPALTPLTCSPPKHANLAGVSLNVTIRAEKHHETRGGFLFTHRGYSGPAVLDISHVAVRARQRGEKAALHVQWTELDESAWRTQLEKGAGTVLNVLKRHLPERLAEVIAMEAGITADQRISQLGREPRRRLLDLLVRYPLPHTGDEGYRKAEVTGGGVALEEVDARTLQSRLHPRLFLCGEVLDAFGPIGGYNFAWAWATGRLAGLAARDA